MTISHVLCPVDETQASAEALCSAADCAQVLDVPLRVFSAVEDPHELARRRAMVEQSVEICIGTHRLAEAGKVDIQIRAWPHTPQAIVEMATDSSLIVMATTTRQHLQAGYVGSATERVIRSTHRPVVTVGPKATVSVAKATGVVVPCDGSALSEAALPTAKFWADRLGLVLTVVSVLDPDHAGTSSDEANYVRRLAQSCGAEWDVLHGPSPAKAISDFAGSRLVVMSSHGRSGFSRLRFGSVAVGTTRLNTAPVIIVSPETEPVTTDDAQVVPEVSSIDNSVGRTR